MSLVNQPARGERQASVNSLRTPGNHDELVLLSQTPPWRNTLNDSMFRDRNGEHTQSGKSVSRCYVAMSPEKEEEIANRGGRTTGREAEMKQTHVKQKRVKL